MECWNSGILGFGNLGIWTSGLMGKNSLHEKSKIGHLPLIPLFHHSSIPIFQLGRSP
jgi:hypothetical protein